MIDFIHSLPTPTLITNFEREIIDCNNILLDATNAGSLFNLQKSTTADFFVDANSFKKIEEDILSGKTVNNKLVAVKGQEKKLTYRSINGKVISAVDQLIIVQSTPAVHIDNFISQKFAALLTSIEKLSPYLNCEGRKILENIANSNTQVLDNEAVNVQLEILSKKLIQSFPVLTCRELLICAYIAIEFSVKEIAAISGLSRNSLRVHFHNICQKLQLSSREELSELLVSYNETAITRV